MHHTDAERRAPLLRGFMIAAGRRWPAVATVAVEGARVLILSNGHVAPMLDVGHGPAREVVRLWREKGRAREAPHARATRHATSWRWC